MKCPKCNGSGEIKHDWLPHEKCHKCNGTDYVNMTNEEWFATLSTEEKAEFSMRVFYNCSWCLDGGSPKECPFNEFSEHCPAESKENMVKWLKEIHDEMSNM